MLTEEGAGNNAWDVEELNDGGQETEETEGARVDEESGDANVVSNVAEVKESTTKDKSIEKAELQTVSLEDETDQIVESLYKNEESSVQEVAAEIEPSQEIGEAMV